MREKQDVDGVILLDKALGKSSNKVLQQVRYLFNARKAGHTGSLDPLATGMLPICLGEATKFSQFLLDAHKTYEVTMRLGVVTDTGDCEGNVIARSDDIPSLTAEQLEAVLAHFRGQIQQVPPMFSALKHQGQPLYKLARQGIEIERKARDISIYQLTLLALQPHDISLRVKCSKGTYIRSLVMDIGNMLGCGAHVTHLRRTSVQDIPTDSMSTFDTLSALQENDPSALRDCLLPIDTLVSDLPLLRLDAETARCIQQGQRVTMSDAEPGLVRLEEAAQGFIGVGEINSGQLKAKRMLNTANI